MNNKFDVIVIGGGVIGCSIAYQLSRRGVKVIVLERGRLGAEASSAAAGMLGAQAEMNEPSPFFELARRSRAFFPELAAELLELTGLNIGLVREGILHTAWTERQERELQAKAAWQRSAGEQADWITGDELGRMEPALTGELRGALYLSKDWQVQAPVLAAAFARAAAIQGTELREYTQVNELLLDLGKVAGVQTAEGRLYSEHVVAASGVWSRDLLKSAGLDVPMHPVKGECFSVLTSKPLIRKTICSEECYLVPKAGGRLVVGATVKPHTFNRKVSLEGISQLMEGAKRLLPAIADAEWETCWSGLRPQTGDGLPYIGQLPGFKQLYAATGHYRNGILLSPITGIAIADMITGSSGEDWRLLDACKPDRILPAVTAERS